MTAPVNRLLDFKDEDDELSFANFDTGFSPAVKSPEVDRPLASYFPHGYSLESVTTTTSTSTSESTSPCQSPPATPAKKSNRRQHRPGRLQRASSSYRSTKTSKSPTRFDLYGDDDELQSAEPKISYCEICLKGCNIHQAPTTTIT